MLKNMKKTIISLIAVILVISVANTVFATEGNGQINVNDIFKDEGMNNITEGGNISNIQEGTKDNTLANTDATNATTNVGENLPEKTPYTGIGDYSGLIFVVIFAVSAIYAYKKVKEYNA